MTAVLVIGDDAAIRLAVRRVLDHAGFAVLPEAGASQTLPDPDLPTPYLIIADVACSARLAAIRRNHPGARLLLLSGELGPGKPFTPSRLLAAVRLCLAQPGATTGSR